MANRQVGRELDGGGVGDGRKVEGDAAVGIDVRRGERLVDAGAEGREDDGVDAVGVIREEAAVVGHARVDAVAEEGVLRVGAERGEERAPAGAQEQRLVVAEQFGAEAQRVESREDPERRPGAAMRAETRPGLA